MSYILLLDLNNQRDYYFFNQPKSIEIDFEWLLRFLKSARANGLKRIRLLNNPLGYSKIKELLSFLEENEFTVEMEISFLKNDQEFAFWNNASLNFLSVNLYGIQKRTDNIFESKGSLKRKIDFLMEAKKRKKKIGVRIYLGKHNFLETVVRMNDFLELVGPDLWFFKDLSFLGSLPEGLKNYLPSKEQIVRWEKLLFKEGFKKETFFSLGGEGRKHLCSYLEGADLFLDYNYKLNFCPYFGKEEADLVINKEDKDFDFFSFARTVDTKLKPIQEKIKKSGIFNCSGCLLLGDFSKKEEEGRTENLKDFKIINLVKQEKKIQVKSKSVLLTDVYLEKIANILSLILNLNPLFKDLIEEIIIEEKDCPNHCAKAIYPGENDYDREERIRLTPLSRGMASIKEKRITLYPFVFREEGYRIWDLDNLKATIAHEMMHLFLGSIPKGKELLEDWEYFVDGDKILGKEKTIEEKKKIAVSFYAFSGAEDLAESFVFYLLWPEELKRKSPTKWDILDSYVNAKREGCPYNRSNPQEEAKEDALISYDLAEEGDSNLTLPETIENFLEKIEIEDFSVNKNFETKRKIPCHETTRQCLEILKELDYKFDFPDTEKWLLSLQMGEVGFGEWPGHVPWCATNHSVTVSCHLLGIKPKNQLGIINYAKSFLNSGGSYGLFGGGSSLEATILWVSSLINIGFKDIEKETVTYLKRFLYNESLDLENKKKIMGILLELNSLSEEEKTESLLFFSKKIEKEENTLSFEETLATLEILSLLRFNDFHSLSINHQWPKPNVKNDFPGTLKYIKFNKFLGRDINKEEIIKEVLALKCDTGGFSGHSFTNLVFLASYWNLLSRSSQTNKDCQKEKDYLAFLIEKYLKEKAFCTDSFRFHSVEKVNYWFIKTLSLLGYGLPKEAIIPSLEGRLEQKIKEGETVEIYYLILLHYLLDIKIPERLVSGILSVFDSAYKNSRTVLYDVYRQIVSCKIIEKMHPQADCSLFTSKLAELKKFIYLCENNDTGGFSHFPKEEAGIQSTYFAIQALEILGENLKRHPGHQEFLKGCFKNGGFAGNAKDQVATGLYSHYGLLALMLLEKTKKIKSWKKMIFV
jgi:hypothetical protein